MFVVTNTFQPAFTGISSFFFVLDPRITLEEGLELSGAGCLWEGAKPGFR
jgi:hypothetical protein